MRCPISISRWELSGNATRLRNLGLLLEIAKAAIKGFEFKSAEFKKKCNDLHSEQWKVLDKYVNSSLLGLSPVTILHHNRANIAAFPKAQLCHSSNLELVQSLEDKRQFSDASIFTFIVNVQRFALQTWSYLIDALTNERCYARRQELYSALRPFVGVLQYPCSGRQTWRLGDR